MQSVPERPLGSAVVHAAILVRALPIVGHEVFVQRHRHLVDGLEPAASFFGAEVLVEQQRAVEPLYGAPDPNRSRQLLIERVEYETAWA